MSLKNEIFEGIAAYKALTPTAEDKYKGEMYKIAKRENDDWEERQRAKEQAIAAGRPATGVPTQLQANIPTMSRSDTIGSGPATAAPIQTAMQPEMPPVYRRGGRVQKAFDEGGRVHAVPKINETQEDADRSADYERSYEENPKGIGIDELHRSYLYGLRGYGPEPVAPSTKGGWGGPKSDRSLHGRYGFAEGGRIKAFDDGGLASAMRGGRPEYNPAEDPDVQDRNRADEIIREIISARVGDPIEANDPSIELRERGAADREANRSKSDQLPPYETIPGTSIPRDQARPTAIPPKPAAERAGPTPAAADRADLEAKYRSVIPEPEPDQGPPSILNRDSDDATLSTDNAAQPPAADSDDAYLSTDNAREAPDADRDYRRQIPLPGQDQPISDAETQAIKTDTPLPKSSRYRDWAERGHDEDAAGARETREDWNRRMRERRETRGKASAERQKAEPGIFEKLTPQQQQERRQKQEAADKVASSTEPPNIVYPQREEELRALEPTTPPVPTTEGTENLPAKPSLIEKLKQQARDRQTRRQGGTPTPPAAPAAPTAPATPPAPAAARPDVPAIEADAGVGVQTKAPSEQYGPPAPNPYGPPAPSVGTNTPGGRPGGAPTPPPGAATANRPTDARKSLGDQTRVEAFDPTNTADVAQAAPQTRQALDTSAPRATGAPTQLVAQGDGGPSGSPSTAPGSLGSATGYSNQDIATTLNGASTLVRPGVNGGPPPVGHLAASPQAFNAYVDHHSQGGKFTPGEAMLIGMVSDYKMLLKQGRVQQANQMAYGLLQAANIEAASRGMVARDKLAAGDTQGAKQSFVDGLNYIGDGVTQRLTPDGQTIESVDPRTGQVMARTPADGRTILAGIMGLADGTLFWKTLQASASMLQKPDRGGEGRALTNELRRRQIALADQRLKKGNAPRGGPTTSGGMSQFQRDLARIRGDKPTGGGGGGGGPPAEDNSDLAIINTPVVDQPEPADNG